MAVYRALVLVVIVALAFTVAGCGQATIAAPGARVPVLLGPVGCIGCNPLPPDPKAPAALPYHASRRELVSVLGHGSWEEGTAFAVQVQYDGLDPCTEDLRLSQLRARTWTLDLPPLLLLSQFSIEANATRTRAPRNACVP